MTDTVKPFTKAHIDILGETDSPHDEMKLDKNELKEFFYDSIWEMIENEGEVEDRDLITKQAQAMISAIDIDSHYLGNEEEVHEENRWDYAADMHYTEAVGVSYHHSERIEFALKEDAPESIKALFDHEFAKSLADDFKENFEIDYTFHCEIKEVEYTNDDAPKPKFSPPPSLEVTHQPNAPTPPAPRR